MASQSSSANRMASPQSSMEFRHARRLSKPRTNTSSVASLNASTSFDSISPSSSEHTLDVRRTDVVVPAHAGDCRSRRNSRSRIRAHLFGKGTDESDEEKWEEDNQGKKSIAGTARGVRDRISRTSTLVSKRASLQLSLSPLASQSRLSLVPESSPYDLEETNYVIDQIKERAFHDNLAALNHVSSPIDEDMHVDAIASPIRRRSLLTPGLATRVPSDILRKPPPPIRAQTQLDPDYYYNSNLPETSPLSQLAALDLANRSRFSPVPRASTPSDRDYSHLGGLGLGTLRITNGTDSPAPTICSLAQNAPAETSCQEDYFTASEGRHSDNEDIYSYSAWNDTHQRNRDPQDHIRSSEFLDRPGREVTKVEPYAENLDSNIRRPGSPLKSQYGVVEPKLANEHSGKLAGQPIRRRSSSLSVKNATRQGQTDTTPFDYVSKLPESPSAQDDRSHPKFLTLEITSKATEFEDELFDEDGYFKCSSQEGIPNWRSAIDEAEGRHGDEASRSEPSVFRQFSFQSGCGSDIPSRNGSTASGKAIGVSDVADSQTQTDSGYNSGASLRSLRAPILLTAKDMSTTRPTLKSSLKSSQNNAGFQQTSEKTVQRTDALTSEAFRAAREPVPARPSLLAVPHQSATETSVSSSQTSSETVTTLASSLSFHSQGSSEHRKLKKARPLSLPAPVNCITVQCYRELSQVNIPPIPVDVATRHAERLRKFPQLDHTFPSSSHTDLRDSSSSPDPTFVPIRFPSPTSYLEEEKLPARASKDNSKRANLLKQTPIPAEKAGRRRSFDIRRSLRRRSSQPVTSDQYDVTKTIAEFSDVTQSLGGSPYDLAQSAETTKPSSDWSGLLNYSRERTVKKPKPRNFAGMDEEQIARFARMRSEHRSRSLSRFDEFESFDNHNGTTTITYPSKPPNMLLDACLSPPTTSCPKRSSFNDRGGVPGKLLRPRSMHASIPPVPALPSVEQMQKKEAELSRSRFDRANSLPPPLTTRKSVDASVRESKGKRKPVANQNAKEDLNLGWEAHRQVWSQRRKSAGEVLSMHSDAIIPHNKTSVMISPIEEIPPKPSWAPPPPPPAHKQSLSMYETSGSHQWKLDEQAPPKPTRPAPQPTLTVPKETSRYSERRSNSPSPPVSRRPSPRPASVGPQNVSGSKRASRPFHIPFTPSESFALSNSPSTTSLQSFNSAQSQIQPSVGRFDGGLSFGYEPGVGVGGSAGTRNMKSGASRKSVEVSMGYGIDLSDVPIFVAPSL